MGVDAGGAALGAGFGLLLKTVKETLEKTTVMFKPMLKNIKGTLECLQPLIQQIKEFNMELDLPEGETTDFELEMKEGEKLVTKCSKVGRWKFCIKPHYTDKLIELDQTLKRLIRILQVQATRDSKENLMLTRDIHTTFIKNNRGNNNPVLVYDSIISAISCGVPQVLPPLIVGLDEALKELKIRLLNATAASLLVVTAPGGCGKTLLAQKFCLDHQVQEKFKDNIFFVPVSRRPPSLSAVVQQLYKHKRYEVPVLISEADAIIHLEQLLRSQIGGSPILLVLDDVWPASQSLVENFVLFQIPDYKILVTSRSPLPSLGPPRFAPQYELKPLNDKDAMTLFRHWASMEDGSSHIPDDDVVKKIVDSHKVIPLALKVVAGSLSGQPAEVWKRKLEECPDGSSSSRLSSDTELLHSLQSSIDDLEPTVKECFMDLALFSEDQMIPVAVLVDMWTELYELEDNVAIANIFDLAIRNLVNLVVIRNEEIMNGYYGGHFVAQHDMLRDLAIDQSIQDPVVQRKRLFMDLSGDNLPNWLKEHEDHPFSARLMSISTDEKFSSRWWDMQLPEVEALVLNFRTKNYTLPKFVKNMTKLKVLIVTNCCFRDADISNFQLLGPLTDLTRIRLERISISSLSNAAVPLKHLQKISLFMCNFDEAFKNDSNQISAMLPNLKELYVECCENLVELPAEVCDITPLENISITNCPQLSALPDEMGKLVNLEVLRLRSCIKLRGLPESIRNLSKLFLDISDCINIQNLPEDVNGLCSLRKLGVKTMLPPPSWNTLGRLKEINDV